MELLLTTPSAASLYDLRVGWEDSFCGDCWEDEEVLDFRAVSFRTHGRSVLPARVLILSSAVLHWKVFLQQGFQEQG